MLSFSLHLVWGLLILREFLPGGHFLLHIIGALMCCKRSHSEFFPNLWWWRIFERVWKQWDVVRATRITKQPRKLLPQGEDLCHCCQQPQTQCETSQPQQSRWATTLHGTSSSQQLGLSHSTEGDPALKVWLSSSLITYPAKPPTSTSH